MIVKGTIQPLKTAAGKHALRVCLSARRRTPTSTALQSMLIYGYVHW